MRFPCELKPAPSIDPAVRQAAEPLAAAGHKAWLAGEELAAQWWAPATPGPVSHRLLTDAPLSAVLDCFPHAVVITPRAAVLPSTAGPIDIVTNQVLPDCLVELGFTLLAVAWDLANDTAIDPYGGLDDVRAGRLRWAGSCDLERDPLLALRALRLVGELGVEPDADLVASLGAASLPPRPPVRTRGRAEWIRLIGSAHAGRALELGTATGLTKTLAPSGDRTIGRWIDALPPDIDLRLAVWLGPDGGAWLREWRFGVARTKRILELACHHPMEDAAIPKRDASVGRLLKRLAPEARAQLFAAREAQLASGVVPDAVVTQARAGMTALRSAIDRVEGNRRRAEVRSELALSGAQVMEVLGLGPGPQVGRALRHLASLCETDPSRNDEPQLLAALAAWAAEPGNVPGT